MPRTFLVNAVDVALAAPVAAPDLTITVDDAAPLPPTPFYLVVDPFSDTDGREYMLCTNVAGVTLTVTRNLEGTAASTHQTNDIVRITIAQQHIDDIWDAIDSGGGLPPGGITGDSLRKMSVTDGDAEFRANAVFDVAAPTSPLIGDFWMDMGSVGPPGGGYLPLGGGTMTGDIQMDSSSLVFLDSSGSIDMLTGTINEVWKIRASDAAGLITNTSQAAGDLRMLQLTTSQYTWFKSDGNTAALQYNRTQDFWNVGAPLRMQTNDISGIINLLGDSSAPIALRPGSGQRVIFRDDVGSRFIIEPSSLGDMTFYDVNTQPTLLWDESAGLWKYSTIARSIVDVTLGSRAMRNITVSTSQPNNPNVGDVWMDNS